MDLLTVLLNLLILVLVLAVVYWIASLICGALGAPPIVMIVVQCILALIVLIWLVQLLGGLGMGPYFHRPLLRALGH